MNEKTTKLFLTIALASTTFLLAFPEPFDMHCDLRHQIEYIMEVKQMIARDPDLRDTDNKDSSASSSNNDHASDDRSSQQDER